MAEKKKTAYCVQCGVQISADNGVKAPKGWCDSTGYAYFCIDCQQEEFKKMLAQNIPARMAAFYCCAAFNVPYIPSCAPTRKAGDGWKTYLKKISDNGLEILENGETAGFLDGVTDIQRTAEDRQHIAGTEIQRRTWGQGPEKHPYTDSEYDELDAFYDAYTEQLERGGGPDAQQEHTIRLCARCNIEVSRALAAGKPEIVQKYNKIIQDNLAAENLRKKDAKPIDDLRIDSLTDALERKGYLRDGKILSYEELLEKLRGDVPHYRYTRDAADQMLLAIMNTMRANEGMSEYTDLPLDYRIRDYKGEFAETPNAREIKAYNQLGLLREGTRPNTMLKNKPARVKRQKTKLQPKESAKKEAEGQPDAAGGDTADKEEE